MRAKLVRIGNSRGIRLPKALIEEAGLEHEVELELRDGCLVITAVSAAREGWDEAFREMAARGDDKLVHGEQVDASTWDDEEWEW